MNDIKSMSSAKERGISLSHGKSHSDDHKRWSRRDFLARMGFASAGAAVAIGGSTGRALAGGSFYDQLAKADTDRVLVLVQLAGGNDGLNTIVPIENDEYYRVRPDLAIAKANTLEMTTDYGLNPNLEGFKYLWDRDQMSVIQGVGYSNTNKSHFRGTDIVVSASDYDVIDSTGWLGRHIDAAYPDFESRTSPVAFQIGSFTPILMQGPRYRMGASAITIGSFELIANRGEIYDTSDLGDSPSESERWFVRNTVNQTFQYGEAIRTAYQASTNTVEYPSGTKDEIARSLAAVARSIRGGLGAKIYVVQLRGFDTHVRQEGAHPRLLKNLSDSLKAFYVDLATDGIDENVLTLTFSEFGRRVAQNGGIGTDHGTTAPMMAFGPGVSPGMFGAPASLTNLDRDGNFAEHHVDYRQVYSTVLRDWFGVSAIETASVMGRNFDLVNFVANPVGTSSETDGVPDDFTLGQNFPNPFNPSTTIQFRLPQAGHVRLEVYSVDGKKLRTLMDERRGAGVHDANFDASGLPSGTYLYSLTAGGFTQTRKMSLLR